MSVRDGRTGWTKASIGRGSAATLSHGLVLMSIAVFLSAWSTRSDAVVGSERPAAILVFPLIALDTGAGSNRDTEIEIANTQSTEVAVECFYVNGLGSCSASLTVCETAADCPVGENCVVGWQTTDFLFKLTPRQVISWRAGQGLPQLPCDPAFPGPSCLGESAGSIPSTPTDPFLGELKCVEVSDTVNPVPVAANDLIGTATIVDHAGPDAASYSAIGIESTGVNNHDLVLCLGAGGSTCPQAEYAPCPAVLGMNHFFDNATVVNGTVRSSVTLVPCSQDFAGQQPTSAVATFMITNEFELRTSLAVSVRCFRDLHLAENPIFGVALQGSLAGYTRIQGITNGPINVPLLGVVTEEHTPTGGGAARRAAFGLTALGRNPGADIITLPALP